MIRKIGNRFSGSWLKQKIERDDDSKTNLLALGSRIRLAHEMAVVFV
jgi:hypothetical protein